MHDLRTRLLAIAIGLVFATSGEADERLDLLKHISASGAPALTLKMLDQAQPKFDENLYAWILWEQERLSILVKWQQWDELLVRLESLPSDIPLPFKQQTVTYEVRAYLALQQTDTARQILREQLWQIGGAESAEYELWRQLIIRSYLADNRVEDARIAMLRFDQDFDNQNIDWLLLRAQVLIDLGRYEQANAILRDQEVWQARAVRLYASHRLQLVDHTEIWRQVERRSQQADVGSEELASIWALGYFVASKMSPVDRVVALESLFRISALSPIELFQLPVDLLWDAYVEYAVLIGNRAELLRGDDEAWYALAQKSSQLTPVKSRALFAMLMLQSTDPQIVNRAGGAYLDTFAEIDEAERRLIENLFNRSDTFSSAQKIPPRIRYQLVDLALQTADIVEATRLMSGLNTVPDDTSAFDWQLRQSRVLILGGRYDEGNRVLHSLIDGYQEPSPEQTDRILQVLFDLQSVGLDADAITHFNQLLLVDIESRRRREILYWIADSYRALQQYDRAALLYLQSAMMPGPDSMDPWAQTARFSAAESLQSSGLIDDARRIYDALLRVTDDPARRSVLNHKIQQLWLHQSAE